LSDETIVAVYDSSEHAESAVRDLKNAGVPSSAIQRHGQGGAASGATTSTAAAHPTGFWASLFGGEPEHEHDTAVYDRSMESGSSVVTVKAPEEHLTQVLDILERHDPIDLDERAASYGLAAGATTTTTTTAPIATEASSASATPPRQTAAPQQEGEQVVSLSEEQLHVGKRLVNRGTTRIRRFVVETPVEEAVTLHSERASVERRPVAAGETMAPDFTDRTVEVTETDEEAVVAKTARVKEEVVIKKAATEHVETVRDTVRREDVEITRDGTASAPSGLTAPRSPGTKPGARPGTPSGA
jgi:uncharacterized protein (TIGR02271 family)